MPDGGAQSGICLKSVHLWSGFIRSMVRPSEEDTEHSGQPLCSD